MAMTGMTEPAGTTPDGILSPPYRRLTVGIVATVVFIAFEAMAVATAMPRAVRDLDGLPMYAWAFSAYFTASLFAMVLSGEACDRRGPRLPLLAGAVVFTSGLIVAGTAQGMWPFVAGRAAQGLGGGLVIVEQRAPRDDDVLVVRQMLLTRLAHRRSHGPFLW
jgi:MFS family permease